MKYPKELLDQLAAVIQSYERLTGELVSCRVGGLRNITTPEERKNNKGLFKNLFMYYYQGNYAWTEADESEIQCVEEE